ncbi:hypothetical protein [Nioella nitratireducens]|uniref:hypothetical protein n=1 Tax=Nioella nitratireducens TaxID=1287720 RepID=UPI0008FCFFDD|nr:hypothetical protein [Nioella nitratireducens]
MQLRVLYSLTFLALITHPVSAEPSAQEFEQARTACRDAFLARDAEAYLNAAATMISWGEVAGSDLAREVDLCLALADALEGASPEAARMRAAELAQPAILDTEDPQISAEEPSDQITSDTRLADFLERVQAEESDIGAVAADITADDTFAPPPGSDRDALEAALIAYVRPIPAAQSELNLTAYRALARLNPDNTPYHERVARYEQAIEAAQAQLERTARQLENRLIKTTAEFDGSSWARHPSSPRYQDIRDYVTLYLIESGTGQQTMELFVNYTSRDGWLFVQNASINIDGETSRLPINQWFRDNDTEIWEFGDIRGDAALSLARRIADSERAVIRFNGQQFYDDYVVSDTDKRVIREMLAMWDVISAE